MRQWLRSHLTYANVISTLCLFLVLGGGTAVALSGSNTVFSDDIVDNQVFSSDVRNDTLPGGGLTGADIKEGSLGKVFAARRADKVDTLLTSGSFLGLSVGENRTLFASGPFSVRASCTDQGSGRYRLALILQTFQRALLSPTFELQPGESFVFNSVEGDTLSMRKSFTGTLAIAPSGASIQIGDPQVLGVHIFGYDCLVNLWAVV